VNEYSVSTQAPLGLDFKQGQLNHLKLKREREIGRLAKE
jgi:hypothetical protein